MKTVLNQLLDWCNEFDESKTTPTHTNLKDKIWQLLPQEQLQIHDLKDTIAFELGGLMYQHAKEPCYWRKQKLAEKYKHAIFSWTPKHHQNIPKMYLKISFTLALGNWSKIMG